MSPTAATKAAAETRLTPGTLIRRRISPEQSPWRASSDSIRPTSESKKSTSRKHPSTVSDSSAGSSSAASHARPALPKTSVIGGRPFKLRASTAWHSFLARVLERTSFERRCRRRRRARVNSSGENTAGRNPAASSSHKVFASSLSVLTLDSAMARSLRVLAIRTRPTCGSRIRAIACAGPVASSATWSSAARLCANSRRSSGDVLTRPASRNPDSSLIATSQKSRCTSSAMERM